MEEPCERACDADHGTGDGGGAGGSGKSCCAVDGGAETCELVAPDSGDMDGVTEEPGGDRDGGACGSNVTGGM